MKAQSLRQRLIHFAVVHHRRLSACSPAASPSAARPQPPVVACAYSAAAAPHSKW